MSVPCLHRPALKTIQLHISTQQAMRTQSRHPRAPMVAANGSMSHFDGLVAMRQPYTEYSASMAGLDMNRASRSGATERDCFMERHYG